MEKLLIYILPSLTIIIAATLVIWAAETRSKRKPIENIIYEGKIVYKDKIIYKDNIDTKDVSNLKEESEFICSYANLSLMKVIKIISTDGVLFSFTHNDGKSFGENYMSFERLRKDKIFRILV